MAHALRSLAPAIAVFTVASEAPRRTSLVVLAVMPAYLAAALALYAAIHATALELFVAEYLSGVAVFLVAWFAGDSVRTRRQRVQDLEARADRLEREQAERALVAVQNERALIARELHDIVAHSVSVMVVQATAAQRILDDQPDEAREAMHSIETTGREALGEMRRLLGILRSEEGRAPLEPQRGLAGIGAVILEGAGRGGVSVDLVVEGEPQTIWRLTLAGFAFVPAMATMAGVAALAVALRHPWIAWLAVTFVIISLYLGALLRLPQWLLDASPVGQTKAPTEYSAVALTAMVVAAVALTLVAGAIYRRRDAV